MLSSPTAPDPAAAVPLAQDARTIGLIGLAHGTSHFHHLLLAPLFPWFISEFALSYGELGLLMTLFFVISGIGQALAGFLVDRIGARPVLFAALGCFSLAGLAGSFAQGYGGLALAAALAGLGNAPFHPVDFTILNKRVSQARLGHAFSVHGLSGNLGWAFAPLFLTGLTAATGSWRMALLGASALALVVLLVMVTQREALDDRAVLVSNKSGAAEGAAPGEHPMAFLRLPSVWLCFSFFFWSTAALSAIQSFASPALQQIYGVPVAMAALVVSGFMFAGAAGMLVGGFLVARVDRLERTIALALLLAASLLALAGSGWVPAGLAVVVASLAGFGTGLAGPSRDMLIRRAAPPGATGRVYGTVYSGLDMGFAIAAPLFGRLLDHGQPNWVFLGAALALLLGIASAAVVGLQVAARRPVAARAPA